MAEIWDAYDKDFNKIENVKLIRGEPVPDGIYHLVCDVIVKHTDGTYLLMMRDPRKHFGGRWELTAGGSALAGETPEECAARELREETGITALELKEIRRIVHDVHHSYYVEFLCITDTDKNAVTLQEGETVDYRWVDKASILSMSENEHASSRALAILRETDI